MKSSATIGKEPKYGIGKLSFSLFGDVRPQTPNENSDSNTTNKFSNTLKTISAYKNATKKSLCEFLDLQDIKPTVKEQKPDSVDIFSASVVDVIKDLGKEAMNLVPKLRTRSATTSSPPSKEGDGKRHFSDVLEMDNSGEVERSSVTSKSKSIPNSTSANFSDDEKDSVSSSEISPENRDQFPKEDCAVEQEKKEGSMMGIPVELLSSSDENGAVQAVGQDRRKQVTPPTREEINELLFDDDALVHVPNCSSASADHETLPVKPVKAESKRFNPAATQQKKKRKSRTETSNDKSGKEQSKETNSAVQSPERSNSSGLIIDEDNCV